MEKNYYEILGLTPDASEKDIKQAYYRLARELHPDKAGNEEERRINEEVFSEVSKAYNVLKDKTRRLEYDRILKKTAPAPASVPVTQQQTPDTAAPSPAKPPSAPAAARRGPSERTSEKNQIAKKAYVKGMQYFKINDFEQAIPFLEAAIQNDDREALYYYRLAVALTRSRKKFTKAVEYCSRAIEMDPYNMEYKLLLGEIYELIGGIDRARKIYEEILKWDATNEKALQKLAKIGGGPAGTQPSDSFFVNLFRKLKGK